MMVGTLQLELHFPAPQSLKEKRWILKSLLTRLRQEFNVGVAELGGMELWQSSAIAAVCVGNERKKVEQVLDQVLHFVDREHEVRVMNQLKEIL